MLNNTRRFIKLLLLTYFLLGQQRNSIKVEQMRRVRLLDPRLQKDRAMTFYQYFNYIIQSPYITTSSICDNSMNIGNTLVLVNFPYFYFIHFDLSYVLSKTAPVLDFDVTRCHYQSTARAASTPLPSIAATVPTLFDPLKDEESGSLLLLFFPSLDVKVERREGYGTNDL